MKPNLFIVGAPKCGTTAWVEYLGTHPDIFFSPVKEPHHFATDRPPQGRITRRDEYLRLFQASGPAKIVGEASVTYLLSEAAARNIHDFNPDAKIIILLRAQEDYLPSRHNQLIFNGEESLEEFEAAWRMSGKRDITNVPSGCKDPKLLDYRAAGTFSPQVERFYAFFPAEQIRVVHFDDWVEDPRPTYLEFLRLLGVPDDGRTEFPPVHQARHHEGTFMVNLVRHPPAVVRSAAEVVKKVTRRSNLGLADWVLRLDARPGSLSKVSAELKSEIRGFYAEDNARLQKRIWSK
jgi:sulfotransferase family protein